MTGAPLRGKHLFAEAFCLMQYRDPASGELEWIWNSRDGVTPFLVPTRAVDGLAEHVDWHADRYAPDHVPVVGDRVFVDLTPQRARELRRAYVDRYWDAPNSPLSGAWPTKEAAIEALVAEDCRDGQGQPDLVVVDEAFVHELLAARAATPLPPLPRPRLRFYVLDEHGQPRPADHHQWAEWFERANRTLAFDQVGAVTVSTVFIGIDARVSKSPPGLWETMVSSSGDRVATALRYSSLEDALEGHHRVVAAIRDLG